MPQGVDIITHTAPTMLFIGVTTGGSSINRLFPLWADILGLRDARLVGVDLPLNAPAEDYRAVVRQIEGDPLTLGGLITTHKIDLYNAAHDMFDEIDRYVRLCGEVACISKRAGRLIGGATDPITAGQSIDAIVGAGYWARTGADVLCLGAGGAGAAILTTLTTRRVEGDRPRRLLFVDIDPARLAHLRGIAAKLPRHGIALEFIHNESAAANDRLMAGLPPGSMVVNATGMGKDRTGSPITDEGRFPQDGVAWELNYRGPREFLQQARAQAAERNLTVEDGWYYFLIGWAVIVGEIFDVNVTPPLFERMAQAAEKIR
jgi:shikimate 5-dehydrogenase